MKLLHVLLAVILCISLHLVYVNSYTFQSNVSAYQRLDLHDKHSSFGHNVVVQNDVAIVTAPHYSFNEYQDPDGILYVYRRDNGFWTLIRGITDLDYGDQFGLCADMHTDYFAVIGAPLSSKYGSKSGAAYYVYIERDPYNKQSEVKQIVQSERHQNAGFGSSVAVGLVNDKVTVVIGAPNHRGRGAIFTYTRLSDGTLGDEEILYTSVSPTATLGPQSFGTAVQVGYDMVLGGAPGGKRGFVYVFERGSGQSAFSETAILTGLSGYTDDNDDETYQQYEIVKQVEEFGATIEVGDGYVFVGAPFAYSLSDLGYNYGSVTVFKYSASDGGNTDFDMVQTIVPDFLISKGLNSLFGISLCYCSDDKRLVVGSPYGLYAASSSLGYTTTLVYDAYDDEFELEAVLTVDSYKPDANNGDMQNFGETDRAGFGHSVSTSNGYILVGAPQGASHFGDAYFFAAKEVGGGQDSTSFYELITHNAFTSIGLFLFPVAIIGLVMLMVLWKKYKESDYDESFSSFAVEEIGECFGRVNTGSSGAIDSCTSLQFMGDDDSAHSTHPMVVSSSVPSKKKSKKGKSSKFKSKTSVGMYESANYDDNL